MIPSDQKRLEQRVIVLAPTSRDGVLIESVLGQARVDCACCETLEEVCQQLDAGAAALLLAEEPISEGRSDCLTEWLNRQPPWSDLPILITARPGADSAAVAQAMDLLGNVTVLERPIRVAAMVSAIRTALRARHRQYQLRNQLAERERELEALARLGAIVASSDDAIISTTLENNIESWNQGAERLYGYSPCEVIGQPLALLIPADRYDEEEALLERLRRGERIEHFETVRVAKDGRRINVSLSVSPVLSADGKFIGTSKVARDITDRKRAEAALRDADRRKDEFLATLAHELRNPLAPIRNSLHLLRLSGDLSPSLDPVREIMERQVDQMVRLIDDLLDISRISRGKFELQKEAIELATIVSTAVETAQPLIDAAGHQLAISLPAEPMILDADPVRLAQIIGNLLNNAAKYTRPGGQIWLSAHSERGEAVISVRDTGLGIPAHMLELVFEKFEQVDRTLTRAQGGLGIGLTLAKTFVEMHGGRIEARSDGPDEGSEFLVYLPLLRDSQRHFALSSRKQNIRTSVPRCRILIVDDTRASGYVLGKLLEKMGHQVRNVSDAAAALESVRRERPDLVISDIGMPNIDGYELARRLRKEPRLEGLLLVALTGYGQDSDKQRAKEAGFDYHLVKPVSVEALQDLLSSLPTSPEEVGWENKKHRAH